METRKLICINCPLGCPLTVTLDNGKVVSVEGNTCPKGEVYAVKEVTDPTRIVTSSVAVEGSTEGAVLVSCKTESDIPKGKIHEVALALKGVRVKAPVHIGDVLVENAAGTGVNIIATKNVL
jgi:CxxC motif-containing protein